MGQLNDDLEVAASLYRSAGDGGQLGATIAIGIVNDFLKSIGAPDHVREPVGDIFQSMIALQYGKRPPIFDPVPCSTGRPGDLAADRAAKVRAAAAMELYIRDGEDREAAARSVARQIGDWRIASTNGRFSWQTVARWRTDFSDQHSADDFASLYRFFIDQCESSHEYSSLSGAADALLKQGAPYQPQIFD